jgi:hypothetical protein
VEGWPWTVPPRDQTGVGCASAGTE